MSVSISPVKPVAFAVRSDLWLLRQGAIYPATYSAVPTARDLRKVPMSITSSVFTDSSGGESITISGAATNAAADLITNDPQQLGSIPRTSTVIMTIESSHVE
jgi:hypothetical protein